MSHPAHASHTNAYHASSTGDLDASDLPSESQHLPAPELHDEGEARLLDRLLPKTSTLTQQPHTPDRVRAAPTVSASPLRTGAHGAASTNKLRLSTGVQFPAFIQPWLLLLQRIQEEHARQIDAQRRQQEGELHAFQQQMEREIAAFVAQHSDAKSPARPCSECPQLRARIASLEARPAAEHVREQALVRTLEALEQRCNELDAKEADAASKYQGAQELLERLVAEHRALQGQVPRQHWRRHADRRRWPRRSRGGTRRSWRRARCDRLSNATSTSATLTRPRLPQPSPALRSSAPWSSSCGIGSTARPHTLHHTPQ